MTSDFIVTINFLGGGVWGRADSKDEALKIALKEFKEFVRGFGKIKTGAVIEYNFLDLTDTGVKDVRWDDFGTTLDGVPIKTGDAVRWQYDEVTL